MIPWISENKVASFISCDGIYGVLIVTPIIAAFLNLWDLCSRKELSTPPEKATTNVSSSFRIASSFEDLSFVITKHIEKCCMLHGAGYRGQKHFSLCTSHQETVYFFKYCSFYGAVDSFPGHCNHDIVENLFQRNPVLQSYFSAVIIFRFA